MDTFYRGTVMSEKYGRHQIKYDDGEQESLRLSDESWRKVDDNLHNMSAFTGPTLASNEQDVLRNIMDTLGNKAFMRHHAEGYQQPVLIKAYNEEESEFLKTVSVIPRSALPPNSNVISSHTIYKIKVNDDDTLKMKARIAPHGNEDSIKAELKSDCNMCSPSGIRIILAFAALKGWIVTKADVKAAFLQTGLALRDVYVIPPRECTNKNVYWLLLAATYGLVNANAKWQSQSDQLFKELGLVQCPLIPQLF